MYLITIYPVLHRQAPGILAAKIQINADHGDTGQGVVPAKVLQRLLLRILLIRPAQPNHTHLRAPLRHHSLLLPPQAIFLTLAQNPKHVVDSIIGPLKLQLEPQLLIYFL